MLIRLGFFFCMFCAWSYADKALEIELDRHVPTDVLLAMIANSSKLSGFQKMSISFWIAQRSDQVRRVMAHVDGSKDFIDLKHDIQRGMHLENISYDTQQSINNALYAIERDQKLVSYVNQSLQNSLCVEEKKEAFGRCLEYAQSMECDQAKKNYKQALELSAKQKHSDFVDSVVHNFTTS